MTSTGIPATTARVKLKERSAAPCSAGGDFSRLGALGNPSSRLTIQISPEQGEELLDQLGGASSSSSPDSCA